MNLADSNRFTNLPLGAPSSLLRALFDSPHLFICLLSDDGRIIDANARARVFSGRRPAQLKGLPVDQAPWWADRTLAGKLLREAIAHAHTGKPAHFSARLGSRQPEKTKTTAKAKENGKEHAAKRREDRDAGALIDFSLRVVAGEAGAPDILLLEGAAQNALTDGFFRAATIGMAIMDGDLRCLHLNETLAAIGGQPAAAQIGKPLGEIIPGHLPAAEAAYRHELREKAAVYDLSATGCSSSDYAAPVPTQAPQWTVSLFPIVDADHETACVGGVVIDVGDRVRVEEALRAKARELSEVQRLANVGSWEWLPETNSLYWSPEMFNITGLPPERAPPHGEELAALFRAEDWLEWQQGFKCLLTGEAAYATDLEVLRPDGTRRWVIARGESERDGADRLVKVRGTMQDITVRKRAEVEARQLAREVIDLYQNAPCGYHSLDSDGRFVRINDTELGWLGYRREELLGRKITDILTPASQRRFNTSFPLLRLHGRQNNIEHDMVRKDGSILPILLNATAIVDARGSFVASRATVIDMTEQREAAKERHRQEARHVEISRHMIDLQEEERRSLALEVHDVVSPNLAAVLINLGIIEAGLPQETMKHLGERLRDVRQLIHETNLSLRNICANLRPSMLDYAGLHAAVDNYVQQFTTRTGLRVEIVDGHRDGRLASDVEILLFRIVQEALANCAKHAHASHVTIELQHDCEHAKLVIADDGVGFDPDTLIAAGRKPGLGLLTMGERAEFAGGEFRLESRPGQGTRITVNI